MTQSDEDFSIPARPFVRGATVACILIGGQVLLGWALGIEMMKSLPPGLVTMKVNAALGFILGGLALLRPTRRWGIACAAGVAALGVLTLAEYFLGIDLGVDQWLFREPPGAIGTVIPNRMAPTTALNFALLGAALVLVATRRGVVAAQVLALVAATVAVTALVGYLCGVNPFYGLTTFTQIALITALTMLVLALGVLFDQPDRGLMAVVTSDSAGGLMARRLMPVAALLPIAIGGLAILGCRSGLFNERFGSALIVLCNLNLLLGFIWWNAASLHHIDGERCRAVEALRTAHDALEVRVAERTAELAEANAALRTSERKFRAIFDQIFQHIGLLAPDGILLEINRSALEFGGLDRLEVIGNPFWEAPWWSHSGEGRERLKAAIAKAARGEFVRFEAEVLGAGGRVATLDVSLNPVRDETGRVILLVPEGRDITERVRLDRAVQASELKFRTLLEFAPDPILVVDHDGRIVLSNARTVETFGYAAEELHGQPVEILVPEALRRVHREHRARYHGHPELRPLGLGLDLQARRKDGAMLPVEISLSPLETEEGLQVMCVVRDITERKRAEQELRNQAQLLDLPHDTILVRDLKGRILYWNHGAELMYGWSREEALGQVAHDLLQTQFPTSLEHIHAEVAERGYWEGELIHRRRGGSSVVVASRWVLQRDERGAPRAYLEINTDITERKQVEVALQRASAYNRSLIEASVDPLVTIGPDGTITDVNEATEIVTGCPRSELVGKDFADFFTEPERARAGYQQAFGEGSVRDYALEIRHRDGHTTPVLYNATVYRDESGRVAGVFAAARDITERKRAEQELRASELRYHSLIEATAAIVWNTPASGEIEVEQPGWGAFTGQNFEQYRGWGWLDAVHPEDRAHTAHVWSQAVANCTLYQVEHRLRRHDGEYRDMSVHGVPILEDGTVREWVGAHTDITERRRAEQELERQTALLCSVLDSMADGVVVADAEERFLEFNPAAERMFGRGATPTRSSEWPARYGLFLPDEVTPYPADQLPLLRAIHGEEVDDVEIFVRHERAPEGLWILINGRPIWNSHRVTRGGVVVCHDITGRKRAEQELARSNAELEQFAYVASHDLQEPLRMVSGFTQMLARRYHGQLDAKADQYIHHCVDGCNRMQRLIQDLLEYARVGTRGRPPEPVAADAVLSRTLGLLGPRIAETEATVTHDPLPVVAADPTQLGQLLQNLIGNALKFRRADAPPRVHISAAPCGDEWVFCVADNGIGLEPQYAERIFGIFQRLHTREEYEGTGIGLAICKKIVTRHGGRIWVESQPGRGSRFYFTLPEGVH